MCLVGLEAHDHKPVIIEVHGDRWASIPALLTRDKDSTEGHQASTPWHTQVSLVVALALPHVALLQSLQ
jgi:hypothetical protein